MIVILSDGDIARPSSTGEQMSPVPPPDWERWNWASLSTNETVWRQESSASWDIRQPTMSPLLLRGFRVAGHMTRRRENNPSHILNHKHENINTKLKKAATAGDFSAQAKTTGFSTRTM